MGKLAVGAVVMNRIRSPLFPDTIETVVYEPGAFTCVADGQIWEEPEEESFNAALDAIMGVDPTGGCLFYYNPRTATSRWMQKRPSQYRETIGNHIFMR
ncbi:MAG: hypothetical protein GX352_05695 [Clostridiales bacterium]|nr:hypothetical protein [Clostridiales bacterium]